MSRQVYWLTEHKLRHNFQPVVAIGGDNLQMWKVAANILHNQERNTERPTRGVPTGWEVGMIVTTHSRIKIFTNIYKRPRICLDCLDNHPELSHREWNWQSMWRKWRRSGMQVWSWFGSQKETKHWQDKKVGVYVTIWGFHGVEYENYPLWGFTLSGFSNNRGFGGNTSVFVLIHSVRQLIVKANFLPSSPILVTLMMKALSSSETSDLWKVTRCYIPDDCILQVVV
jgi:hypothetical protein